jgi:hypothetical protein
VQSYSQALQRITGGELGKDCVVSAFCAGRLALQWEGDRLKRGIGQGTHKEVAPNLQYWMMMMITKIVIMTMMMPATKMARIIHLQQPLVWP